eukprot:1126347-Rhodomonas_salina.1
MAECHSVIVPECDRKSAVHACSHVRGSDHARQTRRASWCQSTSLAADTTAPSVSILSVNGVSNGRAQEGPNKALARDFMRDKDRERRVLRERERERERREPLVRQRRHAQSSGPLCSGRR